MENHNIKYININKRIYEELKIKIQNHIDDLLLYSKKINYNESKTLNIVIKYFYKDNNYINFYDNNKYLYNNIFLEKYDYINITCILDNNEKINFLFKTHIFISCFKDFKDINLMRKILLISNINTSCLFKLTGIDKISLIESPFNTIINYVKYINKDTNLFYINPKMFLISSLKKINKRYYNNHKWI